MTFESDKRSLLAKADKSRKGSLDEGIRDIVELINSSKDYYTTSSCSGRVMVIAPSKSGRKHEVNWLFCSHGKATCKEIGAVLKKVPRMNAFLKQESAILHVCCRNLESARKLLELSRNTGFKRAGIIALGKRIVVEIIGAEHLEAIVARNGRIVADSKYVRELVREANQRMEKNRRKLELFTKMLRANINQDNNK